MIKKLIIPILLILIIFSNSVISTDTFKSLDNFYYILALGIDATENNNIKVTIQILETSGNSSKDSKELPILYTSTGTTLIECLNTLESSLNKQINLSHCSSIIFSDELLKTQGILKIISTLGNSTEIRNTSLILSCNKTSSEFLKNISNSNENFTANTYEKFINSSYDIGYTSICNFGKLFSSCKKDNTSTLIPFINQINNTSSNAKTYKLDGCIIIKNGQYINNISSYETLYLNLLNNTLKSGSINIKSPFNSNEFIDLTLIPYKKTKIKTHLINNSPFVEITIYPEFIIQASGTHYDYLSEKNVNMLKSSLYSFLKSEITKTCNKITHELNTDLLNLNDLYKSKFLTLDEFNKLNFKSIYQKTFYSLEIQPHIISSNLFNKQ